MAALHIETPTIKSDALTALTGVDVYLKLDTLQPSGSFKIRGIGYHVQQAIANRGCTSLISSSGGNAGMAVAHAGQALGIPSTIVVPEPTPEFMIERLSAYGAKVIRYGGYWDEAHREALRLVAETEGSFLVHPFDHPEIWEGHKSIVPELVQQIPSEPSAVICAVGGGGLFTGLYQGLHESIWNRTQIVAVETVGAESFGQCLKQAKWVKLDKIDSIAKSLGALQVTEEAFRLASSGSRGVQALTVTDAEAVDAVRRFLNDHRMLIEPSCGAALAALYTPRIREQLLANIDTSKPLVVFVCGGSIITEELLNTYEQMFV